MLSKMRYFVMESNGLTCCGRNCRCRRRGLWRFCRRRRRCGRRGLGLLLHLCLALNMIGLS